MRSKQEEKLSKFLSLVLRHHPEAIGITIQREGGWARVDALLKGMKTSGRQMDFSLLEKIVREDAKMRYSFSTDKRYIRANQGHSIDVDLGLAQKQPPDVLYHGTAARFLDSIKAAGITRQGRQYVHLSADLQTATAVGRRHGAPAVLSIDSARMAEQDTAFYLSENGVWLCRHVPWEYVRDIYYPQK